MMMAIQGEKLLIKQADPTQMAIIKSWNTMRWNRGAQMLEGTANLETLTRLAKLVKLPAVIERKRQDMIRVQQAVDKERNRKEPKPLVSYPVKANLFQHQVRAANMALLTFGLISPEEVDT